MRYRKDICSKQKMFQTKQLNIWGEQNIACLKHFDFFFLLWEQKKKTLWVGRHCHILLAKYADIICLIYISFDHFIFMIPPSHLLNQSYPSGISAHTHWRTCKNFKFSYAFQWMQSIYISWLNNPFRSHF